MLQCICDMYKLHSAHGGMPLPPEVLLIGALLLILVLISCGALGCYGLWWLFKFAVQMATN